MRACVWGGGGGQHFRMMTDIMRRKSWPHIRHIKRDFDKMGGHHANRISMLGAHCLHTSKTRARHPFFNFQGKVVPKKESDYCSFVVDVTAAARNKYISLFHILVSGLSE